MLLDDQRQSHKSYDADMDALRAHIKGLEMSKEQVRTVMPTRSCPPYSRVCAISNHDPFQEEMRSAGLKQTLDALEVALCATPSFTLSLMQVSVL